MGWSSTQGVKGCVNPSLDNCVLLNAYLRIFSREPCGAVCLNIARSRLGSEQIRPQTHNFHYHTHIQLNHLELATCPRVTILGRIYIFNETISNSRFSGEIQIWLRNQWDPSLPSPPGLLTDHATKSKIF